MITATIWELDMAVTINKFIFNKLFFSLSVVFYLFFFFYSFFHVCDFVAFSSNAKSNFKKEVCLS
jgi:hypothetical protein